MKSNYLTPDKCIKDSSNDYPLSQFLESYKLVVTPR